MRERKRKHQVKIWMNDEEYKLLKQKVDETGQSQQTVILNAIAGHRTTSAEEVEALKEATVVFADAVRQMRGIGNNINQIAKYANTVGVIQDGVDLQLVSEEIKSSLKECEIGWQSIRQSIGRQSHMELSEIA